MTKEEEKSLLQMFADKMVGNKTVFTVEDLSKYTSWSTSTIYKLTSKRLLPFSRPNGGRLFFSKEKIDQFLLSKQLPTEADIDKVAIEHLTLNPIQKGGKR